MELLIKTVRGEVEALTDYDCTVREAENEKSLDVTVTKTARNDHAFEMIENENVFVCDGDEYVIKKTIPTTANDTIKISASAIYKPLIDLADHYVYSKSGKKKKMTIEDMVAIALEGSGYSYAVSPEGLTTTFELEDFGDGFSNDLLRDILDKYKAEYTISGKKVVIAKELGRDTDYQIRHKFNSRDEQAEVDTSSLKTYIRGFGKQNDKTKAYAVELEYTSPLAEIYGIKHAAPIRDDSYTSANADELELRLQEELTDTIELSLTLTYTELKHFGVQDIRKGDYVWCMIDPFGINKRIKVVGVERYSDPNKSPVYTFGKLKRDSKTLIKGFRRTEKRVSKLFDATGKVKGASIGAGLRIGSDANFDDGYDPTTIPKYGPATAVSDGLMTSGDYQKLQSIVVGPDGKPQVDMASATKAGLMSATDFIKISKINVNTSGSIIDISSLANNLASLVMRVEALEAAKGE
ncbi:phage tail protein [Bacillus safensis]|uniref:phage tail protein n=1 Tax=Bacillus safensis TaxID=561879 RepID=UPI00203B71E7|nr:phage tail protein [Bacillus safensis]MCM3140392.1 phage tail protein [Bacillus safensis]